MKNEIHKKKYRLLINELAKIRQGKELRQIDLATKLNVPQSFVSKYESGERRLDVIELLEICRCLNVPFKTIIDKIENL